MLDFIQILNKGDKLHLYLLIILFVLSGFIEVLGIASIAPFIALLTKPEMVVDNKFYNYAINYLNLDSMNALVIIGILVVFLFALSNIVTAYSLWSSVKFTAIQQHKISMNIIKKYLYQPYDFYLNTNSSLISKNILHEAGIICDLVILPALQFISKLIILISVSIFLLIVNHEVFLSTVLILGIVYFLIYYNIKKKIESYGNEKVIMNKAKYKYVNDAFSDIKNVKFYNIENKYINLLNEPTKKFSFLTAKTNLLSVLPRYILEILAFGGILSILIYYLSKDYNILLQSPMVGVFIIAAYRMLPLLQHVYQNYTIFTFNSPVTKIINDIYALPEMPSPKIQKINFTKKIDLNNVCFSHNSKEILKDVSMLIEKSKTIGIIGESGQGKTTLVDILLGFHSNYNGDIIIDNNKMNGNDLLNMRSITGYVSQDMNLINMTIEENIAFSVNKSEINSTKIKNLLKIVELENFVSHSINKSSSILSERGLNISGGQKQRILIARALYNNPELLILDESTNALDVQLENKILNNIKTSFPEITIILITHRDSLLRFCDNIYRLKNKTLIEYQDNIV